MTIPDSSAAPQSTGRLRRSLGLYAVLTISIGSMIGSGIFVLPGLAFKIAGPSVVLAFFLAGVVVLPAALSKAEMATAMPEAGGTYLYIDRAMGPLMGTIAGFGADGKPDFWISESDAVAPVHVAFTAADRATVDAFHAAALSAGGGDNGAPGIRSHYHENYYGAFVHDPDGHNVEAVCHAPG